LASDEQNSVNTERKPTVENPQLEEFFQRLPANLHWPKPGEEAVGAVMEAIQHMVSESAAAEVTAVTGASTADSCFGCGSLLGSEARFCPQCGLATRAVTSGVEPAPQTGSGALHHYHHHYHHFVSSPSGGTPLPPRDAESSGPRGRAPDSPGTSTGGRAELRARQVAQDWAQACNTKHLDDLMELYASDATLIRSNLPPVRSLPAIREFLHAVLEAGLGDLAMESLRTEVMGEIAMDLGRCKMLVPVAMGKRREERGKYLLILVRQPAGTWKILADCWSSDHIVSAPAVLDGARKASDPGAPIRKPR
jgi:ketosteroid isomerase-like protein